MIDICRNCGIQVEVHEISNVVVHRSTRTTFCDVIGRPPEGKLREAELLTVGSKEEAIEYRNFILNGSIPIPVPKGLRPRVLEPYVKVTIIFEEPNKTTTYTIPQARNVVIEDKAIPVSLDRMPREYLTDSMDLSFNLTADFDLENRHVYLVETKTIGVTVED